ncbi:stage II sporulation protein R [Fictibacillus gelatini]|uniref:stage II sporulation protein R n=1 Tax=Fictibacillus gelatini TaxID=225985 RepID=UPI00047CFDA9|nr:stage II sporulation protein R [Fictibacillus gelatini]
MKKKHVMMVLLFSLLAMVIMYETQSKTASATMNSSVKIPNEAIRLRILANSDSDKDQAIKQKVRDEVNQQINTWVADLTSFKQAHVVIRSHLPEIKKIVRAKLHELGADETFTVQFGKVPFPTKMYGDYVYPAGKYDAVLITLGKGKGANWWCVLFPPLCFLDFENGDAVKADGKTKSNAAQQVNAQPEKEEVHVKFFLVEWLSDLFHAIGSLFS